MIDASASGEPLTLHTSAGDHLDAELFRPAPAALPAPGIVVAPEMYGVNAYLRDVARTWCTRGYFVLLFDALWRIRRNMVLAYQGPDNAAAHAYHDAFDFERCMPDVQAALDALRAQAGANAKAGIVGFCLGGTLAYLAAARTNADAAVGYYGSRIVEFLDDAAAIDVPLLLHFGSADKAIPAADRERVIAATAGNAHIDCAVHASAPHAFANHVRPERYHPASARAADDAAAALFRRALKRGS